MSKELTSNTEFYEIELFSLFLVTFFISIRFKTDDQERSEKGLINKNGETSVVGAYSINYPNGLRQTTMYVADKNGYHPQVQLRFSNVLKSLVGK